jgi:hypothetical protein
MDALPAALRAYHPANNNLPAPPPTPHLDEILGGEQPAIESDPESQGVIPLATPVTVAHAATSAGKSLGGVLARWPLA